MNALVCRTASRTLKHDLIKWRSIGCAAANRDNDGSESDRRYHNAVMGFCFTSVKSLCGDVGRLTGRRICGHGGTRGVFEPWQVHNPLALKGHSSNSIMPSLSDSVAIPTVLTEDRSCTAIA